MASNPYSGSGPSCQGGHRNAKDVPTLGEKQSFHDYESRLNIWSLGTDVPASKMVPVVINCGFRDVPKVQDRAIRIFEAGPSRYLVSDFEPDNHPLKLFIKELKSSLKLNNESARAVLMDEYNRMMRSANETYEEYIDRSQKMLSRMARGGVATSEAHACNRLMMGIMMTHVWYDA